MKFKQRLRNIMGRGEVNRELGPTESEPPPVETSARSSIKHHTGLASPRQTFPDRAAIEASADQQTQASFLMLPREVREAIYVAIWRYSGLAQHVWSFDYRPTHHGSPRSCFGHCPCVTKFNLHDRRQTEVSLLKSQIAVPLGPHHLFPCAIWSDRLKSRWYDHWPCAEEYESAAFKAGTSHRNKDYKPVSPFIPLLTTCRRMYLECVESIYKNIIFSLTDTPAAEALLSLYRYSRSPNPRLAYPSSPWLLYLREVNISLEVDFSRHLACSYLKCGQFTDFHWLALPKMQSLRRVKIWVDGEKSPRLVPHNLYGTMTVKQLWESFRADYLLDTIRTLSSIGITLSLPGSKEDVDKLAPMEARCGEWGDEFDTEALNEDFDGEARHGELVIWVRDFHGEFRGAIPNGYVRTPEKSPSEDMKVGWGRRWRMRT